MLASSDGRGEFCLSCSGLSRQAILFGLGPRSTKLLALARSLNLALGDGPLLAVTPSHPRWYAFNALLGRGEKGCAS